MATTVTLIYNSGSAFDVLYNGDVSTIPKGHCQVSQDLAQHIATHYPEKKIVFSNGNSPTATIAPAPLKGVTRGGHTA